ncbi:hypothetical protein L3X38_012761 [Prunus dulcis]|uniref:Uncharacterized protein n=1 Tax=Prunus dulcis TaxID=3755 RepID=A0AAD4WLK9_PRUDU|nr:hypothetical protein L3X38_012761 [Prunus dulcis]
MEDQRAENEPEWADAVPFFYQPDKRCIYRVPNKLRKSTLKSKEELKSFITDRQGKILSCYAGTINQGDNFDFSEVILVDALFIIQLFMMDSENPENDYHILRSRWLRKAVEQDLILLENQLPFFLLKTCTTLPCRSLVSIPATKCKHKNRRTDIKDVLILIKYVTACLAVVEATPAIILC